MPLSFIKHHIVDNCPVCCSAQVFVAATLDSEERNERFRSFSMVKYGGLLDEWFETVQPVILGCRHCGHSWYKCQPSIEMLEKMYAISRRLLPGTSLSRNPTGEMCREMARFRRFFGPARFPSLLDFGSGFGRWARAAVKEGFNVTAYEPAVSRGNEEGEYDFELVHELAALEGRRFEAINLEQVLEHVPDPLNVLHQVRKMSPSGGIVRITVPNLLRTPEGKNLWCDWPFDGHRVHTMAPYEHLHGFTPQSLCLLAKRAGLTPVRGMMIWRNYPIVQARSLLGGLFPRLGITKLLVCAA